MFGYTIGIEWSPDAVRAARHEVHDGEIYLLGDVKAHLVPALAGAPPEGTTLLLDPPAEGLDAEIHNIIAGRLPARIIYVSCHPATLARDIKRLANSYTVRRVTPVDMFPQTAEIEVVALLEKTP
jgi:23S rRNA (uracil1939-C5)-methyltransferase